MYFKDYGMEKRAIQSYASLTRNAAACAECNEPACIGKCPYGLPVKKMLCYAHDSMSLMS